MKPCCPYLAGLLVACSLLSSCGGSPDTLDRATVEEPDPREVLALPEEKTFHEWERVYAVETRTGAPVRTHVGYLDRRFTLEDRDGKLFVLDLVCEPRGFIVQDGRAYACDKVPGGTVRTRDLGSFGIENGIKKILDVPGAIEREKVKEASTAPAKE